MARFFRVCFRRWSQPKPILFILVLGFLDSPCFGASLRKVLFFDEEDVLYRSGTEKVLHELQKVPHPGLLPYTGSGGEPSRKTFETLIAWVSVYRKPNLPNGQAPPGPRWQLWFQGYTSSKTTDKRKTSNVCYAISDDGITWKRPGISPGVPGLGLFDFIDNTLGAGTVIPPPNPNDPTQSGPNYTYTPASKTNIVLIGTGGHGDRYGNCVIVDPDDPDPNRRYKMVLTDWANTTSGPSLDDPGTFPNNVTPNPNPDPAHIGSGTQVAFSPDGVHWTKFSHPDYPGYPGPAVVSKIAFGASGQPPTTAAHADNPEDYALTGSTQRWQRPLTMSDAQDVFIDPRRNKYVIAGKMWVQDFKGDMSWKHAMGWTESSNFIDWSEPELLLTTGDKDPDGVKFHTSPVFYYEGMYLSLNQIYTMLGYTGEARDKEKEYSDIELMSSRDGKHWDRNYIGKPILRRGAVNPNIPVGEPGYFLEFDSAHIFTNSTPVILPDEMRFYYGAYGDKSGVGLATAKRDRIVGIKSLAPVGGSTVGQVTLKKVDLTGCSAIAVNAVAQAGGEVRVELLNREGRPIPNFTKADAIPLTGDAAAPYSGSVGGDPLNRKVRWSSDLSALPAADRAECLIRIHLKNAELFSCTLVP